MSRQEGGLAVFTATWLLALAVLGGLVSVDVATLLRAARVAASAADGAALAASSATQPSATAPPRLVADRIARAHGATVDRCDCGERRATVAVRLPVRTRLLAHLGIDAVRATSTATLVPATSRERTTPRPADPRDATGTNLWFTR